jgi:uroporphyrinogen-III synthase
VKAALAGKTIVLTRPREQCAEMARAVRGLGGRVVVAPTIRIAPPGTWRPLDAALARLSDFDCVVFTSRNAVEAVFSRGLKLEKPRKVIAVGPRTAKALAERGWRATAVPSEFNGAAAARVAKAKTVLLPRAKDGRPELAAALRKAGAKVTLVEAYRTLPETSSRGRLRRADFDAVAFTSGSTAKNFVALVGRAASRRLFERAVAASIGPTTTKELRALGIRPAVQARRATSAELVAALARHFGKKA